MPYLGTFLHTVATHHGTALTHPSTSYAVVDEDTVFRKFETYPVATGLAVVTHLHLDVLG